MAELYDPSGEVAPPPGPAPDTAQDRATGLAESIRDEAAAVPPGDDKAAWLALGRIEGSAFRLLAALAAPSGPQTAARDRFHALVIHSRLEDTGAHDSPGVKCPYCTAPPAGVPAGPADEGEWRHARWIEPHLAQADPDSITRRRAHPDYDTAACLTCGEILLPATPFGVPADPARDEETERLRHDKTVCAFRHRAESMSIDRRDWTREQWIDDARQLMDDLDGSVMSLANGHVTALLAALADRGAALDKARADGANRAAAAINAFRASRPARSAPHYLAALRKAEEIARAAAHAEQGDAG